MTRGASPARRSSPGRRHISPEGAEPKLVPIGGRRAVAEAIRAGKATRVLVARGSHTTQGLRAVLDLAATSGVRGEWVDQTALDRLRVPDAQGVIAMVRLPHEIDERELLSRGFAPDSLVVILDGITDPQNLGAAARSAEAAGASLLISRKRRSAPLTAAALRASAGALLHLPVARVPNLTRAIEQLLDRGFSVTGLDDRADRSIYEAPSPARPLALVVGAEGEGISRLVRERCDLLVSIPMAGRTGSLNAAAALAVGLFAYAVRPPS